MPGSSLRQAQPTNSSTLTAFLFHVTNLWRRTLRQWSQKDWTTWERIKRLADDWLPKPRILHPWPESRFAVRHPKWEAMPELGPYGSVRGARGNSRPYRESHPATVKTAHFDPTRTLQSLACSNCLLRLRPQSFVGLSSIRVRDVSVLEVRIVAGRSSTLVSNQAKCIQVAA